ncbi:MAG TPA: polyprenyl synthetase family protein [Ignavibacteria bacterium]|nr:polyprenyl synthetase family protein [Ignavibacteria bacterium]
MENHTSDYKVYKKRIDEILTASVQIEKPHTLYDPLKYLLSAGGKRIRPMLVLISCEAAGGKMEDALYASVAMELLHNFTLVHDDIMDNADTRRGKETIHKKWNSNVAILSGDHLIGMAYMNLLKTRSERSDEIVKAFTEGILEVCEGQSYDKEFEIRKDVSLDEYIKMIGKKTAKMLETSAVVGALIGNGNEESVKNLRNYASNIGLAFQILDDLLDINSTEEELGKKIGGDLVEGKKTFLLLKALELVNDNKDLERIKEIINNNGIENNDDKIAEVKNIYQKYGVIDFAKKEIEKYTQSADKYLNTFPDGESKEKLKWFSGMLMSRSF